LASAFSSTENTVHSGISSALVFADFLKEKKLVRGSNPHLWEDDGEDKDNSDWVTDNDSVMSVDGECDE